MGMGFLSGVINVLKLDSGCCLQICDYSKNH